jgi:hypothetical protein
MRPASTTIVVARNVARLVGREVQQSVGDVIGQ